MAQIAMQPTFYILRLFRGVIFRVITVMVSAIFELLYCRGICTWGLGTPLKRLKRINLGTVTRNTVLRTS
jgi:hypothetical protein